MINRIKALLSDPGSSRQGEGPQHSFEELQIAAAALLVEAAETDARFDSEERDKIQSLARQRFGLNETEARTLIELARQKVAETAQLYGFTRVVKDSFDYDERVEMMEMLWEVAYADGELHDLEANLMRRVAGLIFVSDRDSGTARKRALGRLGLEA